jgi:hypothetical protein
MFFILRIGDGEAGKHNALSVVSHFSTSLQEEANYQASIRRQLEDEALALQQMEDEAVALQQLDNDADDSEASAEILSPTPILFAAVSESSSSSSSAAVTAVGPADARQPAANLPPAPPLTSYFDTLMASWPQIDLEQFSISDSSVAYSLPVWDVFAFMRHWAWE